MPESDKDINQEQVRTGLRWFRNHEEFIQNVATAYFKGDINAAKNTYPAYPVPIDPTDDGDRDLF